MRCAARCDRRVADERAVFEDGSSVVDPDRASVHGGVVLEVAVPHPEPRVLEMESRSRRGAHRVAVLEGDVLDQCAIVEVGSGHDLSVCLPVDRDLVRSARHRQLAPESEPRLHNDVLLEVRPGPHVNGVARGRGVNGPADRLDVVGNDPRASRTTLRQRADLTAAAARVYAGRARRQPRVVRVKVAEHRVLGDVAVNAVHAGDDRDVVAAGVAVDVRASDRGAGRAIGVDRPSPASEGDDGVAYLHERSPEQRYG